MVTLPGLTSASSPYCLGADGRGRRHRSRYGGSHDLRDLFFRQRLGRVSLRRGHRAGHYLLNLGLRHTLRNFYSGHCVGDGPLQFRRDGRQVHWCRCRERCRRRSGVVSAPTRCPNERYNSNQQPQHEPPGAPKPSATHRPTSMRSNDTCLTLIRRQYNDSKIRCQPRTKADIVSDMAY